MQKANVLNDSDEILSNAASMNGYELELNIFKNKKNNNFDNNKIVWCVRQYYGRLVSSNNLTIFNSFFFNF